MAERTALDEGTVHGQCDERVDADDYNHREAEETTQVFGAQAAVQLTTHTPLP